MRDDHAAMGPLSGWLWLTAGLTSLACLALPGASHERLPLALGLVAVVLAYAIACIRLIDWDSWTLGMHATASAIGMLVAGVAVWLSGGSHAFVTPLLILALLYFAYFFPGRYAWPLLGELVAITALPLLYEDAAVDAGQVPLVLARAVSFVGVAIVIRRLKRQLVAAEAAARGQALSDSLTGVDNRRAFEERAAELERARGDFGVLLIDIDGFKAINDRHGHEAGDRVLRRLAVGWTAALDPGQRLARIGGDEFAVLAPGADPAALERLACALLARAMTVSPAGDADPVEVCTGWGVAPADGEDLAALLRAADERLYEAKRARTPAAPAPGGIPPLRAVPPEGERRQGPRVA